MKWWIEHMRPGQPTEYHVLHTPNVSEDGFYRQTTSIDAFRGRELRRRFPMDKNCRPLYKSLDGEQIECCKVERYDEMLERIECFNRVRAKYGHSPIVVEDATEHQSVWAFYEAIGYDYKNQRYTEVTPCK